jgi:hypothetical protein
MKKEKTRKEVKVEDEAHKPDRRKSREEKEAGVGGITLLGEKRKKKRKHKKRKRQGVYDRRGATPRSGTWRKTTTASSWSPSALDNPQPSRPASPACA